MHPDCFGVVLTALNPSGALRGRERAKEKARRYGRAFGKLGSLRWRYTVNPNLNRSIFKLVALYNFSETHYLDPTTVTEAYKGTVFSMTGKVNSDTFRGFSPGEVLFLGAAGTRRGTGSDDDWEITYRFAASPNKTGLTVGDIGGISKKGWERGAPAGNFAKYADLSAAHTRRVATR